MFKSRGQIFLKPSLLSKQSFRARRLTTKSSKPLRILFCGSDQFSIKSLQALYDEHKKDASFIESIDVACRPAKKTGRGLKVFREVPIKAEAQRLGLPIHEIEGSFKDGSWSKKDDGSFNLIIAVSFGLFVPKRVLNRAYFGGLNVHPSVLPDLRGPAPIQHAILQDRNCFGVTVQTLDTEHFDRGRILGQCTSDVKLTVPQGQLGKGGALTTQLTTELAKLGAMTLTEILRNCEHERPYREIALMYQLVDERLEMGLESDSRLSETRLRPASHASKITTDNRRVDWQTSGWRAIRLRHGAVGQLWDETTYEQCHPDGLKKRVIFHQLEPLHVVLPATWAVKHEPGRLFLFLEDSTQIEPTYRPADATSDVTHEKVVLGVSTCDDEAPFLLIKECTIDSGAKGKGQDELKRLLMQKSPVRQ